MSADGAHSPISAKTTDTAWTRWTVSAVLFPLLLNPFERYYLADDRPQYPTTFVVELWFSGQLEQAAFLTALAQAVGRHPLLGALVADGPSGPQWVAGPNQPPALDWADEARPIAPADDEYIDLRARRGLRVWVRTSSHAIRARFQFHHACCDGLAALGFIDEVLVLYAGAVAGPAAAPALPPPALDELRDRGPIERAKPSLAVAVRDVFVTAQVWSRILFRRAAKLAPPKTHMAPDGLADSAQVSSSDAQAADAGGGELLAFESYRLTSEEAEGYQKAAQSQGVPLNDLLLRDLFLAVDDWNRAQGGASGGRVSINMPVSVRGRQRADIPASNKLGFAFVTANKRALQDRVGLLKAVHQQTDEIKKLKLALYFLGGLSAASNFRGVVSWLLHSNKTFATIVLSNVGQLFTQSPLPRDRGRLVCGGAVLERVTGVPPTRPNTRAAIAINQYAGETTVALRGDRHFFRREQTRALLDTYVARLRETARRGT
jgi:hypothetical protein